METLPISMYTDGTWRSRHAGLLYVPVPVKAPGYLVGAFMWLHNAPTIVPIFSFSVASFGLLQKNSHASSL